jgi:uncharacterized repeat protein (TIGR02059 family)
MKKIFFILFLIIPYLTSARTHYVAPTGNDAASGDITHPWRTWDHAFSNVSPGDTVYFRGGVYYQNDPINIHFSTSGTVNNWICFFNYPGEYPILDLINRPKVGFNYGIQFTSYIKYVHFKGLEIRNAIQQDGNVIVTGILYDYADHVIFENMSVHNLGGTGFMSGQEMGTVTFINCDAYDCYDLHNSSLLWDGSSYEGGGSVGFNFASLDTAASLYMYNCRAWHNSDGGFSMGNAGTMLFDHCWAWNNGYDQGDGNGFKGFGFGEGTPGIRRIVRNCIAAYNRAGFDQNNDPNIWEFDNNIAYHNGYERNYHSSHTLGGFIFEGGNLPHVFNNNISYDNYSGMSYGGGDLISTNAIEHTNSWNGGFTTNLDDFVSLDTVQLRAPRNSDKSLPFITFARLKQSSDLIDAGTYVGLPYSGSSPDIGVWEYDGAVTPAIPVYQNSAIEIATPARLEMTYNLTLANIVPASAAFIVLVNSVGRPISAVAISGTKVLLTLSAPVVYGDLITVSYTKPSTNPIQSTSGGEAISLSTQAVTNKISPPNPGYVSSSVENANPSLLEMTYSLALANIIPATSAFTVLVNSAPRTISSITISGTKVLLTLSSPVIYGNVVTVSYTKPSANPLQTVSGGQAATLATQTVSNNVSPAVPVYQSSAIENATPSVIEMTYNLSLANIVPVTSSFTVMVNSLISTVNSVAISGSKVLLTLSNPVVYGDIISVAYAKPLFNPIQTSSGGQAASLTTAMVTNKIGTVSPIYISSLVGNATPSVIEMTYNLALANIIPATSAFIISVNSVTRTVSSIAISGTKVQLTLSSPVIYGDIVTVAYNVPSVNPLQTSSGGQAATISAQSVTNNVNPVPLVYITSAIENATPGVLEMTYNMTLANITPATSAFSVMVNSTVRTVSSVSVSGTRVLLTLSAPIVYGDIVTVSYTKPSTNSLQTLAGGQAETIGAQSVTNKVNLTIPVLASATVENATPSRIDLTYNISLANIVPAVTTFSIMVNGTVRIVSSVAVSGAKILLTLTNQVFNGDVITVTYTKPSNNSIQTTSGGQASSLIAQVVTNNVAIVNTPPVIVVNYQPDSYSGFVSEINTSGSYDANNDNLTYTWIVPNYVPVSSTTGSSIRYLSPIVSTPLKVEFSISISDGKTTQSKIIPIEIHPYKPELEVAEISNIEASSFQSPYFPYNIIDGDIGTMWSADGSYQWIILELKHTFIIQHVKLAFQPEQRRESYFDIFGSVDQVTWEPILTKSASCAFSGNLQVFEFPPSKTGKEFNYIKLVGLGNSIDTWNSISELKIFGFRNRNSMDYEKLSVKIYPNPAKEHLTVRIDELTLVPDFIKILSVSGKVVFLDKLDPTLKEFTIPISLENGIYIVQLVSGNVTLFAQKLVIAN